MSRTPWSTTDDDLLYEHYADIGPSGLATMLPAKSLRAITQRAYKLGIRRKRESLNEAIAASHAARDDALRVADATGPVQRIGRTAWPLVRCHADAQDPTRGLRWTL